MANYLTINNQTTSSNIKVALASGFTIPSNGQLWIKKTDGSYYQQITNFNTPSNPITISRSTMTTFHVEYKLNSVPLPSSPTTVNVNDSSGTQNGEFKQNSTTVLKVDFRK